MTVRYTDNIGPPMICFTVAQVAARWGTSPTFVYSLVASGSLLAFRLGGKLIRVPKHEVEAYECQSLTD